MRADPSPPSPSFRPSLELTVLARADRMALVRDQVERFVTVELGERAAQFPMSEVMLAVQEAIANVARHAYACAEEPGPLEVRVEVGEDRMRLVVRDRGPGYDRGEVADPCKGPPTPGGYGLFLIETIMSRVEYRVRDGANELVMEKRLEPVGV